MPEGREGGAVRLHAAEIIQETETTSVSPL